MRDKRVLVYGSPRVFGCSTNNIRLSTIQRIPDATTTRGSPRSKLGASFTAGGLSVGGIQTGTKL